MTVCSPLGAISIDQLPSSASMIELPSVIRVTIEPSSDWTFLPPNPQASVNSSEPSAFVTFTEPSPIWTTSEPSSWKNDWSVEPSGLVRWNVPSGRVISTKPSDPRVKKLPVSSSNIFSRVQPEGSMKVSPPSSRFRTVAPSSRVVSREPSSVTSVTVTSPVMLVNCPEPSAFSWWTVPSGLVWM